MPIAVAICVSLSTAG